MMNQNRNSQNLVILLRKQNVQIDHTVDVFGIDRIVWGSDSPVCQLGGGLPTWVGLTHNLTSGWSKSERKSFYRENAFKLWNMRDN